MKYLIRIIFLMNLIAMNGNKVLAQGRFNPELAQKLDSLGQEDQKWRIETDSIDHDTLIRNLLRTDSLNQIEAKKIFAQHGFPGNDLVGEKGTMMFFLLVQHADKDPKFQKKVLTELKKQVDKKNAAPKLYAYLLDRVKVNSGEKQVYGTQLRPKEGQQGMELAPVIDPEKLNDRRKAMGLPPIEEYLKSIGIKVNE